MKKHRKDPFFRALQNYVTFFLLVAFIVSCSTALFVSVMRESMGLVLTKENMETAAKLTFGNVLLLSLLFTVVDILRRRSVHRPVNQILQAADRLIAGDFSVRIAPPDFSGADGILIRYYAEESFADYDKLTCAVWLGEKDGGRYITSLGKVLNKGENVWLIPFSEFTHRNGNEIDNILTTEILIIFLLV